MTIADIVFLLACAFVFGAAIGGYATAIYMTREPKGEV